MTVAVAQARAGPGRAAAVVVAALRPRQWTKNLLVFAGLGFARLFDEPHAWVAASAAFVAFCAASSAAYLINDVRDAEHDAMHPAKRNRPVARGDLSARSALVLAACLAVAATIVAAALGTIPFLALLSFLALQAAYSLLLKRLLLADVAAIAALFVLRAVAGAGAVNVSISPWLLVCTALLALFLALAKRRAELMLVVSGEAPGRPVLRRYSLVVVDRLLRAAAIATLLVYTVYAFVAQTSALAVTVPFVAAGLLRYFVLVQRRNLGEAPEDILLTDKAILACVGGWALTSVIVLALA